MKSPSLFVKHIEFVQDYADIGSFTLPVHFHSEARAFLLGRVIVDISAATTSPSQQKQRLASIAELKKAD